MSPWPPRSQSNQQSYDVPTQQPLIPPRTNSHTQQEPNIEYGIPTLHHSRSTKEQADATQLHHARSFSHPFPSLFGGSKRTDKRTPVNTQGSAGVDSTDDETSFVHRVSRVKRDNSLSDKEPVTGRCMTCYSTVRWPREVKVFRCMTCQTINDLEKFLEPQRDQRNANRNDQDRGAQRKRMSLGLIVLHSTDSLQLSLSRWTELVRSLIDV